MQIFWVVIALTKYFFAIAANCRCVDKHIRLAEHDDLETSDNILQISIMLGRRGVK